eukprot:contig_33364_g8058
MPGASGDDGTSVSLRESFKSPHAFRQALADDIDRVVIEDGWMSCSITEGGMEVEAFIRSALRQGSRFLQGARKVRLWSGGDSVSEPTDKREGPLDGDAFRLSHKLYPVRIRIVNVEADDEEWITIAYVPSVATEKGSGGAEQSKQRRIGILQRVLYLALRDLINASHNGATFAAADGRELLAFPRILMYICDQPE